MSRLGLSCFLLSQLQLLASADPFPQGVSQILSKMGQKLAQIDASAEDDAGKISQLKQQAAAELEEAVADEKAIQAVHDAAFAKVLERVQKLVFVGGCPRTFEGCPQGWQVDGGSKCQPSAEYDGTCTAFRLRDFEARSDKEAFALKCRLSWPCKDVCAKDFSSCPDQWSSADGVCHAPKTYAGMCSPSTDFSAFSSTQKIQWASLCDAPWPCQA